MAKEEPKKPDEDDKNGDQPKFEPPSPAKRKLLQRQFEEGSKMVGKGNFDYANEMFTYCVGGDPGNIIYTQNFLGNLLRKYNNNKKGGALAGIKGAGAKSSMGKCRRKKDWPGVVKNGLGYLKFNPWESSVLTEIAAALGEMDFDDCRLEYIKVALSAKPTDVELNKVAALAYQDVYDFPNAIRCWERIAQQRPNDDEPRRMIAHLTVQKTIHQGGYEDAENTQDVKVKDKRAEVRGVDDDVSEEVKLRREIRRKPEEVTNYIALSDYFWKLEEFEKSEEVMQEAVKATSSIRAREHLEDVQLGRARRTLAVTQKKAAAEKTEKAIEQYKRMKVELNNREMEVYGGRCERYPNNFAIKYEFGLRLRLAGKYKEAINQLQQARHEPKRVADANLQLGFCFYKLQRFDLSLSSFDAAAKTSDQWHVEVKKEALYNAGRLARDMKNFEAAVAYLTELAGLDYNYKDVAELLESTRKRLDGAE